MGDADAELGHALQHRGRRRRRRGHHVDLVVEVAPLSGRGVDQHAHDHRRAAQMRHLVLGDRGVDRGGLDPAQAHLGARLQRHRPRKAPAVAVEHGQGPEIGRVQAHVPDQDVADRVQIRAAVVRDHALGPPGGAGGVAERDRLPFVGRIEGIERGIALGQQLVVGQLAQALARHVEHRVRHVDHQRLAFALRERGLDHAGILGVGQQHLGFAVVQDVGDGIGLEAHVQRVDHGARHRDAEVGIDHRGHVRQHRGRPCRRVRRRAAANAEARRRLRARSSA